MRFVKISYCGSLLHYEIIVVGSLSDYVKIRFLGSLQPDVKIRQYGSLNYLVKIVGLGSLGSRIKNQLFWFTRTYC